MDIYLVVDLTVTISCKNNPLKDPKVEKAIRFVEHFVQYTDKVETRTHLPQTSFGMPNFAAIKNIVLDHSSTPHVEVVMLTDLLDPMPVPREFSMPALLRFVVLGDYNTEDLSEKLVAALECVSLRSGLLAGFARDLNGLNGKRHFPILLCEHQSAEQVAKGLAQEKRTQKVVDISFSSSMTLKCNLTPGIPQHMCIMYGEMTHHQVHRCQPPLFRLIGFAPIAVITKIPQTAMCHSVQSLLEDSRRDALNGILRAMMETNYVAVLEHSSGEECFLRPHKITAHTEPSLVIQFYPKQYVTWKSTISADGTELPPFVPSYKATDRFYWTEGSEVQQDVNKLCRRLKRDPTPHQFYEDLHRMCRFAIACDFSAIAPVFASLLEKRAATQDLTTNVPLGNCMQVLKTGGFEALAQAIPFFIAQL